MADQITEWEQSDTASPEQRLHIYNDLYHAHVPKLVEKGVIYYSQSEDLCGLADATDLRPYLEQAAEIDLAGLEGGL